MWGDQEYHGDDCDRWRKQRQATVDNYRPSKMLNDLFSFCKRIQPELSLEKWYSSVTHNVGLSVKIGTKLLKEGTENDCIAYLNTCDIHNVNRR